MSSNSLWLKDIYTLGYKILSLPTKHMSSDHTTSSLNPTIRYSTYGDVPQHIINASTVLYSEREHVSNMKSPLFAATVSYLHAAPYLNGVDLVEWAFSVSAIVDIPMCQCNFEPNKILSLVPSFLNAGYYVSIIGNDKENFVAVYTKFRRACRLEYWDYNIVLYPTDPVHLIGRNIFKIVIKLHRWKWRALEKGYTPPQGRLFKNTKRSFDELMAPFQKN